MTHALREETGRVLFAAVAVWATVVAAGAVEGLLGKFEAESVAAFAVAVSGYALAAYRLDTSLRKFAASLNARLRWAAFGAAAGMILLSAVVHWPAVAVFAAPLATVAFVGAMERSEKPRKARAKSPGATPAAT